MTPSARARNLHTRDRRPLNVVRPRPRPTLPPVEGFHDSLSDRGSEAASASLRPCPPYHRTYDDPPKATPPTVRTVGRSALTTRPLMSTAEKVAPVGEPHPSVSAAPQTRRWRLPSVPVELVVGEPGDGFGTGPGVNPESAQIPVAALSLQHHRRRATLSQMRKRRMAQLVQSPPTGMTAELPSRSPITTTGPDPPSSYTSRAAEERLAGPVTWSKTAALWGRSAK